MSSAETTHPIEWRDEDGGTAAYRHGEIVGVVWPSVSRKGAWNFAVFARPQKWENGKRDGSVAARSYVEQFVLTQEAGQ